MKNVDPATYAVPWAYRGDQVVHLKDFDGNREGLVCGGCKQPVTFRRGVVGLRTQHFAHLPGYDCATNSPMTATHRVFRDAVAQLILNAGGLPLDILNRVPWVDNGPVVKGSAEAEKTVDGTSYVADVLFTAAEYPARQLVLEIEVTHGMEEARRLGIQRTGAAIAVLKVAHDDRRFAECADEAAQFQAALDEIRRNKFRLLSEVAQVRRGPTLRAIARPTVAAFPCLDDPTAPERSNVIRPPRWDERLRPASRPGSAQEEQWALICCPACQQARGRRPETVVRQGGQPAAWHCKKHNMRGAA